MRFVLALGLISYFIDGSCAIASSSKPTNYEVIGAQIDSLAKTLVTLLGENRIKELTFDTESHSIDLFARQRIIEQLLNRKFRLLVGAGKPAQLTVRVPLIQVFYSTPIASHIFGSSDVVRKIRSSYAVQLADSGQVRFANTFSYVFEDTVKESQIPSLEVGVYGFLHGKLDSGSLLNDVVQPILFIGSAAVIVYLFFTIRGS